MRHRLRKLRVDSIDGVDDGAAVNARVTLMKRREDVAKETASMKTLEEILAALPEEERKIVLEAIQKAAQPPKPEEKPSEGEMMKRLLSGVPEEVRKQLEAVEARRKADAEAEIAKRDAEAKAKAAELEAVQKRLAAIEDEKERQEFVAVAKARVFPMKTDRFADVLRHVAKRRALPDDLAKEFETALESVSKALEKNESIAKELGGSGSGSATDPQAQLTIIAKQLREKDPAKYPSEALAYEAACSMNKDLYTAARARS